MEGKKHLSRPNRGQGPQFPWSGAERSQHPEKIPIAMGMHFFCNDDDDGNNKNKLKQKPIPPPCRAACI